MKINKKGISLPELLAVIIIMGLIAVIAIPAFTSIIRNTRKDATIEEIKTVVERFQTSATADGLDNSLTSTWFDDIASDFSGGTVPFGITHGNVTVSNGLITINFSGASEFTWEDDNSDCNSDGWITSGDYDDISRACFA